MTRTPRDCRRHRRRGLAPLEFVLALPVLLFMMALIINFGNVAAWKVRAQSNTRYAGWRTLQFRTGQHNPSPDNWPQGATLGSGGGSAVNSVNRIWNGHPDLTSPVVRGPAIVEPLTGRRIDVAHDLEMDRGAHRGTSHLDRKLPLLDRMNGRVLRNGVYTFDLEQTVFDNAWTLPGLGYSYAGSPQGRGWVRRAKRWYELEPRDFPELGPLRQQLRQAADQLEAFGSSPPGQSLDTLDRDDEFIWYMNNMRWCLGANFRPPDFHPRLGRRCEADPRALRPRVDAVAESVRRRPGVMGRRFRRLYQDVIACLESLDPPPPGTEARIARLERKIEQLDEFLASVPPQFQ